MLLIFSNCESTCVLTEVPASFMIEKPRLDLLTLSTTLYDLSVARNLFLKAERRQFGASGTDGLNSETNLKRNFEPCSAARKNSIDKRWQVLPKYGHVFRIRRNFQLENLCALTGDLRRNLWNHFTANFEN